MPLGELDKIRNTQTLKEQSAVTCTHDAKLSNAAASSQCPECSPISGDVDLGREHLQPNKDTRIATACLNKLADVAYKKRKSALHLERQAKASQGQTLVSKHK